MNKMNYIKPEIEVVLLKDPLMNLELPISKTVVDDEAAKKGMFDDDTDWNSQESIWGKKSQSDQSDNDNWDVWSDN